MKLSESLAVKDWRVVPFQTAYETIYDVWEFKDGVKTSDDRGDCIACRADREIATAIAALPKLIGALMEIANLDDIIRARAISRAALEIVYAHKSREDCKIHRNETETKRSRK